MVQAACVNLCALCVGRASPNVWTAPLFLEWLRPVSPAFRGTTFRVPFALPVFPVALPVPHPRRVRPVSRPFLWWEAAVCASLLSGCTKTEACANSAAAFTTGAANAVSALPLPHAFSVLADSTSAEASVFRAAAPVRPVLPQLCALRVRLGTLLAPPLRVCAPRPNVPTAL